MAYGARLESGLGVKALRGSNPLSSARLEAGPTCHNADQPRHPDLPKSAVDPGHQVARIHRADVPTVGEVNAQRRPRTRM